MNLQEMTLNGQEPASIMTALRRRFTVATRHCPGQVFPFQIEAFDDAGRVRLRIPYFWSERLWMWVYLILPGDRT